MDLTGERFGKWVVTGFHGSCRQQRYWLCRCDCGTERPVPTNSLRFGSRSCGCSRAKHGRNGTAEHVCWRNMLARCNDVCNPDYGGRGISVCARWSRDFDAFLADMGPRPTPRHSIDRIDVNGNYEPGNCRWATTREQAENTRRSRLFTMAGRTMSLPGWAREYGVNVSTLYYRVVRGGHDLAESLIPASGRGSRAA